MKQFFSFSLIPAILVGLFITLSPSVKEDKVASDDTKLQGAWSSNYTNEDGEGIQVVTIMQDSFLAETHFNIENKKFYFTQGGTWQSTNQQLIINVKFDSRAEENVGKQIVYKYKAKKNKIVFKEDGVNWTRLDNGSTSALANPWFFSGRMRDGEMTRRPLRARKTMKIISDTRFQWIAYNDETGAFSGTGGGSYTAENGKYTENIEFFSRNADRVGASLSFDFEVKDGEWHHTGFSSKGDPMHEIWAPIHMIAKE